METWVKNAPPEFIALRRYTHAPTTEEVFAAAPDLAPIAVDEWVLTLRWWRFDNCLWAGYYCSRCRTTFFASTFNPDEYAHGCAE